MDTQTVKQEEQVVVRCGTAPQWAFVGVIPGAARLVRALGWL